MEMELIINLKELKEVLGVFKMIEISKKLKADENIIFFKILKNKIQLFRYGNNLENLSIDINIKNANIEIKEGEIYAINFILLNEVIKAFKKEIKLEIKDNKIFISPIELGFNIISYKDILAPILENYNNYSNICYSFEVLKEDLKKMIKIGSFIINKYVPKERFKYITLEGGTLNKDKIGYYATSGSRLISKDLNINNVIINNENKFDLHIKLNSILLLNKLIDKNQNYKISYIKNTKDDDYIFCLESDNIKYIYKNEPQIKIPYKHVFFDITDKNQVMLKKENIEDLINKIKLKGAENKINKGCFGFIRLDFNNNILNCYQINDYKDFSGTDNFIESYEIENNSNIDVMHSFEVKILLDILYFLKEENEDLRICFNDDNPMNPILIITKEFNILSV
jgi:hypothetical protein